MKQQESWEDILAAYLPQMRKRSFAIYWAMIGFFLIGLGSLFVLRVPVYVRAAGMVRPSSERVFIRALSAGIVDSVYFRDGASVKNRALLIRLQDGATGLRLQVLREEIEKYRLFISDLESLRLSKNGHIITEDKLRTPLFRRQAGRFTFHLQEMRTSLDKAEAEINQNRSLAADRVISPKEWYDIQSQRAAVTNGFYASWEEQHANWEQELVRYRSALNECLERKNECINQAAVSELRSPVAGVIQGLGGIYPGSRVQANDIICSVSPEGRLQVECMLPSKDIGRIHLTQPVVCRLDAFDQRHGACFGRVLAIDNDFSVVDNQVVFRVICSIDQPQPMKKGMMCRARFIIAQRTLWQLLFDRIEEWFV